MFKAQDILTAVKNVLDAGLDSALNIQVQFDEYRAFEAEDFALGPVVVISASSDVPESQSEGFDNGHYRTLNLRFEIRTLGFPTHLTIEPIAKAVADAMYAELKKLPYGTGAFSTTVTAFGVPSLNYVGLKADKPYAGAALDIPLTYHSDYPIS